MVAGKMRYEAIPMYDEIRRVPLLIKLPQQVEGKHIGALVQSPDLMPTILEMSGVATSEVLGGQTAIQALQCGVFVTADWEFRPENIHGKSLIPLMRGRVDRLRDIAVSSNTLIHNSSILAKCSIVTEDDWCLHYAGNYEGIHRKDTSYAISLIDPEASRIPTEPALYCLRNDPHEGNDVIDSNRALASNIHERYVRWLEEAGMPEIYLAGRRRLL
jgi:hypothetical protein